MSRHIFRFDARGGGTRGGLGRSWAKPDIALDFTLPKPSTGKPDPIVAQMLREGMVALPDDLGVLSREELAERGYHFVKWHSRYKRRYVPLRVKRHDT